MSPLIPIAIKYFDLDKLMLQKAAIQFTDNVFRLPVLADCYNRIQVMRTGDKLTA